jgi:hypothetical protein
MGPSDFARANSGLFIPQVRTAYGETRREST